MFLKRENFFVNIVLQAFSIVNMAVKQNENWAKNKNIGVLDRQRKLAYEMYQILPLKDWKKNVNIFQKQKDSLCYVTSTNIYRRLTDVIQFCVLNLVIIKRIQMLKLDIKNWN